MCHLPPTVSKNLSMVVLQELDLCTIQALNLWARGDQWRCPDQPDGWAVLGE